MFRRSRLALLCLVLVVFALASPSTFAADDHCYAATGECIDSHIVQYWERNGGLEVFGMPITSLLTLRDGSQGQLFERHMIELHPENAAPYDIELALVGEYIFYARSGQTNPSPAVEANPSCRYFPETGHNLCEPFRAFWGTHGLNLDSSSRISQAESLALFGMPLTEAYQETGSDGVSRTVQYFERVRFELHPDLADHPIQLGLLGQEFRQWALEDSQPTQTPTEPPVQAAPPAATPEPAPAPPTATPVPTPQAPPESGHRVGAVCRDGTRSNATGRGACSHHGGVDHWIYAP